MMNKERMLDEMIEDRRYLHAHPEIGHQEYNTQKYIIARVESLGLPYHKVNTSTIVDLIVNENYDMIAVRADIDALGFQETNECEYKSVNDGLIHACGHDGHTAIQLGVMKYLVENADLLSSNVRFIFQCDEENNGGAEEICQAGYLNDIKAIYGLHLDNDVKLGSIGYKYGQMNAGGDEIDIIVKGKQAHGAYPHKGIDSIVCSANIITNLQHIVARNIEPLDSTVITIGTIEGAGTPNTICGEVKMRGTIRNLRHETRSYSVERVTNLAKAIGDGHQCEVDVIHLPVYPPLINCDDHVNYVLANAKKFGYELVDKKVPSLGLEDFAYYLQLVPGAFYNIGSCIEGDYRNAHSSTFDFDERALLVGALVQIENCLKFGKW